MSDCCQLIVGLFIWYTVIPDICQIICLFVIWYSLLSCVLSCCVRCYFNCMLFGCVVCVCAFVFCVSGGEDQTATMTEPKQINLKNKKNLINKIQRKTKMRVLDPISRYMESRVKP